MGLKSKRLKSKSKKLAGMSSGMDPIEYLY